MIDLPADMIALYDACGEARLFDGWRLRPLAEHERIDVAGYHLTRFLDLPDGTFVAFEIQRKLVLARLRSDALSTLSYPNDWFKSPHRPRASSSEAWESIPVVGKNVAALLAHVLRSGGATEFPVKSMLIDEWGRRRRARAARSP